MRRSCGRAASPSSATTSGAVLIAGTPVLFFLLLLLFSPTGVSGHKTRNINVILRTCDGQADGCPAAHSYPDHDPLFYTRVLRLLSGGVPQVLFQDLDHLLDQVTPAEGCAAALRRLDRGLRSGRDFAFQVLDASAKFPAAFLQGSLTAYGDYDQCLAVSSEPELEAGPAQQEGKQDPEHLVPWVGKYCMVDMIPETMMPNETADGRVHLNRAFFFSHIPVFYGLCFPSTCSEQDVRLLVGKVLQPYPFQVTGGDVTCDTRDSISFSTRLKNMTKEQSAAILLLLMLAALIAAGTGIELLPLMDLPIDIRSMLPDRLLRFLSCFGLVSNAHQLFKADTSSTHMLFVDYTKLIIICSGVFAHICCCLETPLGFFVLSHHRTLADIVTNTFTQFFFNDGGLSTITFLSAFATYHAVSPPIRENKLRFHMAILDRWLRFVPAVMGITAMDMVWPLLFSGPFYQRVARFMTDKCSANWWYNLLFVSVYFPALELCAPHTYYTSIDFNMFLLGLLATYLLVHHRTLGIAFCILGILVGNACLLYFTWSYNIMPSVVMDQAPAQRVVDYLDVVQMSLYSFFCAYFTGMLLADMLKHGYRVTVRSRRDHFLWITAIFASLHVAETSTALYNTWHVLPDWFAPAYIVLNRLCFLTFIVLLVLYASSTSGQKARDEGVGKSKKDDDLVDRGGDENNNSPPASSGASGDSEASLSPEQTAKTEGMQRLQELGQGAQEFVRAKLLLVLTRLSFSIYMVNYFFIRTDFFTSRTTMDPGVYTLVKRLLYSGVFITMLAVLFQLTVVGPWARVRKMLNYRITRT